MTTIDASSTIQLLNRVLAMPGTVLLDGAGGRSGSDSLLFHAPLQELVATSGKEVLEVLEAVETACGQGFHVAGFLAYEAGHAFWQERFPELRTDRHLPAGVPLAWFGVYRSMQVVEPHVVDAWAAQGKEVDIPALTPDDEPGRFKKRVREIRDLIHEGDVYQVNHTTRFCGHFEGDPVDLYRTVRKRQPVGYGGLLKVDAGSILSFSPELFFEQEGRRIQAEPMKGTAPRGTTAEQDRDLAAWLGADEKNRAENLMIVDLLRNDLSMVSEPGSVRVPERFAVQTLPSVHQMTSRIEAHLREGVGFPDLMRALFPCGSITGAPKVRAMRRIAELETGPRGVYCGAIGYVSGTGAERRSVFSVAIRTAVLQGTDLTLGAGGGIVWDSDPDEEYRETLLKTRFFSSSPGSEDIQIIETMRADSRGAIPWLSWHMDRLEASARALGFRFDRVRIDEALGALDAAGPQDRRVRLLLFHDGSVSVETKPIPSLPEGPLRICLSNVRIASSHPRYAHKTTDRGPYEQAASFAREKDCYDGLLINERGEITEGAITNLFIREGDSWSTPPLECGLLPGVGRRVFLLENAAQERVLYPRDLMKADEVRVTNAIIGQRRAILVEE